MNPRFLFLPFILAFSMQAYCQPATDFHVILIGVDGMSPDGVQQAPTPVMDQLMTEGAYSFHARAVFPTSSGPNWGSMLLGAGPEQHGIFNNQWKVDTFQVAGTQRDSLGFFPSIFDLIRHTYPSTHLAVFHDWGPIKEFFNNKALNHVEDTKGTDGTIDATLKYFENVVPHLTFIHLDEVDGVGHREGHGTEAYYQSVTRMDAAIGRLVDFLKEKGVYDKTYIFITSDHGGLGKSHGGATMAEIEIPWIAKGPRIKKELVLSQPIDTYDTPATIGILFGVEFPQVWIGRPVREAIEEIEK